MSNEILKCRCKCFEKCEPKRECECEKKRECEKKHECECEKKRDHDKDCEWFGKALKEAYWRGFNDGCRKCKRKENECDKREMNDEYEDYEENDEY